jgi:large subunit ribosomal protein L10
MAHGSTKGHAHVAPWKRDEVARLTKILTDSPVVGLARIGGIPAAQMQEMRSSLRADVQILGAKNRLLKLAIAEASKRRAGLAQLTAKIDGEMAVLATGLNPFKLYKHLQAGATKAPLKGGQKSPVDVSVAKGPTAFGPGPIVGELQRVGIPAKIEGPKVTITKDVTPVKAGDVVSAELALMLAKLDIKPLELKIDLRAAFEEDTLFTPDVLAIDDEKIMGDVQRAIRTAFELSLQTAWPTTVTSKPLLTRAFKTAAALAVESGVEFDDAAAKAYATMLAALRKKPDDLSDALRERLGEHLAILTQVAAAPAAPAAQVEAAAEEEEDEGVSEEEAAAGLGALFG